MRRRTPSTSAASDSSSRARTGGRRSLRPATESLRRRHGDGSNDPNIVYLGTGLKTTDGGATWTATNADFYALSMAIDPTNPNIVYEGGDGFLVKTIDGGDTWNMIMDGTAEPTVLHITVIRENPNVVYAGTAGEGGFRSADGGVTWTPLAIETTVRQLIVDPMDSNVCYAGSNGDGVDKSTDGGVTFARIGSPHVGVVHALAKSGNRLYAGTATEGVSVSYGRRSNVDEHGRRGRSRVWPDRRWRRRRLLPPTSRECSTSRLWKLHPRSRTGATGRRGRPGNQLKDLQPRERARRRDRSVGRLWHAS